MSKLSRFVVPMVFLVIGLFAGMNLQSSAIGQTKVQGKSPSEAANTKWEYRTVLWNFNIDAREKLESQLSKMGEEGYDIATEASTPSSVVFVLKRQPR